MVNELLWFLLLVVAFASMWGLQRLFGTVGLYIWMALAILVANVTVVMTVTLFGLTATLGNIYFGSTFAVTDTLCELHGRREAQRAVWIGFCVQVIFTVLIVITTLFLPHESDFAYPHLRALFSLLPRITVASLLAYVASQSYDIWIFQAIAQRFPGRNKLWVRNNLSTLSSQLIDTLIFCLVAFLGAFPFTVVVEIIVTTYLFKVLVAFFDTPFVYLLTRKKVRQNAIE